MSFLHLSLLGGGLFVAVPVLLHLLMRRKPKHEMFPALRFVKQLRQTNQQKIRFKNWLLLLLRCAIVLALALAMARPTVSSENLAGWTLFGGLGFLAIIAGLAAFTGLRGGLNRLLGIVMAIAAAVLGIIAITTFVRMQNTEGPSLLTEREAPVAAALVFDTSPRMGLQFENASRLSEAQDMGTWLLNQLPEDSEVAIIDNSSSIASSGMPVFSIDLMAGQKSVQAMTLSNVTQSLSESLKSAVELLEANQKTTKEIYLLTDLTRRSWRGTPDVNLASQIRDAGVRVYVLDVGVGQPQNVTVGAPQLTGEIVARGSQLTIESELKNVGKRREVTAEFVIEKPDRRLPMIVDGKPVLPELQLRYEQTFELDDNASDWVEFTLPPLAAGSHHGQIRLRGSDGLEIDDKRFFTIQATEHWPVLVATGYGADPRFLTDVLSPFEEQGNEQASFECTVLPVEGYVLHN